MAQSLHIPSITFLRTANAALVRRNAPPRPDAAGVVPRPLDAGFTLAPTAGATPEQPARYRVRRGDTLSHIVRNALTEQGSTPTNAKIHAGIQAVVQANGLRNPDILQPGQQLDLRSLTPPVGSQRPATAPASQPMRTPLPQPEVTTRNRVAGGDTQARLERVQPAREMLRELRTSRIQLENARETESTANKGGPSALRPENAERGGRIAELVERLRGSIQSVRNEPWGVVIDSEARLTSGYGMRRDPFSGQQRFHHGIDLAAPTGTPIRAPKDGTVIFSGWRPGYGNLVEIRHENGMTTRYGHNAENLVRRGDRVAAGMEIARVGSTGRSTGPHVHFEVRREGRSVNPMPFLETASARMHLAEARAAADYSK